MAITKYDPFAELAEFPAGIRLFQDAVSRLFSEPTAARPWAPPVDIFENDNELVLKADVPDVPLENIKIQLENGTLTIEGERKFERRMKVKAVTIALSAVTAASSGTSACRIPWTPRKWQRTTRTAC
jgi:HSP20 family protein